MPLFLLKRLLTLIATLLAASVVVFWVLEILPGNAAQILMGPDASPEAVQALARQLGLDHPPLQRYGSWIAGMLTGNLGNSYVYSTPVLELVLERLTLTVPLAVMAMAMTTVLALAVGVYAASHHNRAGDVGLMAATQVGVAIPNFWFAILLILLFAVHLRWFAAGGFPGWRMRAFWAVSKPCFCQRFRWPSSRRPSWRASRARPFWRSCVKTMCAPRARKGSRAAQPCGVMCCATP